MPRTIRTYRAQVTALPRPAPAIENEWIVAAIAVGLLVAGLLGL